MNRVLMTALVALTTSTMLVAAQSPQGAVIELPSQAMLVYNDKDKSAEVLIARE